MLRLQRRRSGFSVDPIAKLIVLVVTEDLVGLQALLPRVGEPLVRPLEVILDMALPADKRAHLLPRRHGVGIVIDGALCRLDRTDALEETWARDPQLHGLRVVT